MAARKKKTKKGYARTRKHDELVEFLTSRQTGTSAGGDTSLCNTCLLGGATCEAIELYGASVRKAREEGKLPKSINGLWRVLKKHYGYPLGPDALRKHVRHCLDVQAN